MYLQCVTNQFRMMAEYCKFAYFSYAHGLSAMLGFHEQAYCKTLCPHIEQFVYKRKFNIFFKVLKNFKASYSDRFTEKVFHRVPQYSAEFQRRVGCVNSIPAVTPSLNNR